MAQPWSKLRAYHFHGYQSSGWTTKDTQESAFDQNCTVYHLQHFLYNLVMLNSPWCWPSSQPVTLLPHCQWNFPMQWPVWTGRIWGEGPVGGNYTFWSSLHGPLVGTREVLKLVNPPGQLPVLPFFPGIVALIRYFCLVPKISAPTGRHPWHHWRARSTSWGSRRWRPWCWMTTNCPIPAALPAWLGSGGNVTAPLCTIPQLQWGSHPECCIHTT